MLYLNLGCGTRYHREWVNVDYVPYAALRRLPVLRTLAPRRWPDNYLNHDLRRGIPFADSEVDAVYSSHLLEHLPPAAVAGFVVEQRRVLRPGGVIRVVVPDLEFAARTYLRCVADCRASGEAVRDAHEWATILLLDQMVRKTSGGRLREWLVGHRQTAFVQSLGGIFREIADERTERRATSLIEMAVRLIGYSRTVLPSGEAHQWMYDEFSLARVLREAGFLDVARTSPRESRIARWTEFELDANTGGEIHQPGSIYLEATK